MRVRALVAAAIVAAACVLTGTTVTGAPATAQAQDCARPRGPMVAYGHSYLHSPEIGGATASYATLAATALQVKPVIRAVNGGTTLDVDSLVHKGSTKWVPGSADLVLIDSAINDIEQKLPTKQWTTALRHTLSAFSTPPVPMILLVEPLQVSAARHPGRDPKVIAAYAAAQRKVASEFDAVHIVDAHSGWVPRLNLSTDGIHPNAVGMLHLARAVRGTATRSSCSP